MHSNVLESLGWRGSWAVTAEPSSEITRVGNGGGRSHKAHIRSEVCADGLRCPCIRVHATNCKSRQGCLNQQCSPV